MALKKINLFEPSFSTLEYKAIKHTLKSKWTGRGPQVELLEKKFAEFLGIDQKHLTTTTCATEGVFAIFDVIGLNPSDEVIIPAISFVGIANAIKYYNAKIIFCDNDPHTLQIDISELLSKVTSRTKAIVLNHYGGYQSVSQEAISELRSKGVVVIEDSACAFGAIAKGTKNKFLGTLGDFGIWSFDSMKLLSMGDGGLIYAKDPEKLKLIQKRNYFGLAGNGSSGFANASQNKDTWWDFDVVLPGRRAIINDINATLGISQLNKYEELVKKRRKVLSKYIERLGKIEELSGIKCQSSTKNSSPYLFWIQLEKRTQLANFLKLKGIYTSFRYMPLHNKKLYLENGAHKLKFPGADWAANKTLNLPLHANLTMREVNYICKMIEKFLANGK